MAKKKVAAKKKQAGKKKSVTKKKKAAVKKTAAKKSVRRKAASGKKVARKKATAKKKAARSVAASTEPKLGRARVSGDSKLEQIFLKDYEARQVFEFLNVATLKELEQYGPEEIAARLTGPMLQTVNRIRKALALNNRTLKDDEEFATKFLKTFSQQRDPG
jgi:hypothetical protein